MAIPGRRRISQRWAEPSPEDEWALLLVNADHPIDREFCPELEVIQPGEPYQVDARIVDDLRAMMEAARQDGVDLLICRPIVLMTSRHTICSGARRAICRPDTARNRQL